VPLLPTLLQTLGDVFVGVVVGALALLLVAVVKRAIARARRTPSERH
jgi:hypothetical protein